MIGLAASSSDQGCSMLDALIVQDVLQINDIVMESGSDIGAE